MGNGILDPGDSKIPLKYLNAVNDPSPGQNVSTANVSGSIIQPYFGQLGKRLVCNPAMALKLSDTSIGILYEGIYQYVRVASGITPARGQIAYWSSGPSYGFNTTAANGALGPGPTFEVTNSPVPAAWQTGGGPVTAGALPPPVAGIFLCAGTAQNYCYIQISGKATVRFKTIIANGNGGVFRTVVADPGNSTAAPTGTADIMNGGSPINMNLAQLVLGLTLNTPSDAGLGLVDLYTTRQVYGGFGGF